MQLPSAAVSCTTTSCGCYVEQLCAGCQVLGSNAQKVGPAAVQGHSIPQQAAAPVFAGCQVLGTDAQKVEEMKALLQREQDEYVAWLRHAAAESPSIHQHYDHDVACEVEVSCLFRLLQGHGSIHVLVAGDGGCWVVQPAPGM